jgi:two-component system cell cycle sensor histidine kinase/response regulator CckA
MGAAAEIGWVTDHTNGEDCHFFEDAPVGLAECDHQGRVVVLNPYLEQMLNSSIGTNSFLSDLIRPENRVECDKLVSELKDGRRTSFHVESKTACSDGQPIQWIVWRVGGEKGLSVKIFALAQEIDVHSSDRRLQLERLETMGRLAGGVAHDFNNLLTGVLLYCDLLLATLDPAHGARKYAEEIRGAGLQATGLIRQLLALAKPTRNEPRLLSFNEIAEGMRNLLGRLIGENIDLKFCLDPNLGLIRMDPTQAQQVLLNLVLNARDAMPSGGQITIKTADCNVQMLANSAPGKSPASLHCAVFAVEDNGCGMDAYTRAHLFEPFFTTKAGKGTGLGLATVYDIVTSHGGLIHVDSEPGQGTRIGVLLPVATNPVGASEHANEFHPARSGQPIVFKEEE